MMFDDVLFVACVLSVLALIACLLYRYACRLQNIDDDEAWSKEMQAAEDYFNRGMPAHARECLRRAGRIADRRKGADHGRG